MRENEMSLSKWRTTVLVLAVALFGITVVSPALGGPSLKKLVKKEVRKQIAKLPKTSIPTPTGGAKTEVIRTTLTIANNSNDSDFADCPSGERATGGGVGWDGGGTNLGGQRVIDSQPVIGHTLTNPPTGTGSVPTGWFGQLGTTGTGGTGYVWVICVPNP
jgi:hypothetical protein